jgi:hypothetical protein
MQSITLKKKTPAKIQNLRKGDLFLMSQVELKHQGVDLVDHRRGGPQVRFFEAIERGIH